VHGNTTERDLNALSQAVIDSVSAQIAVLAGDGTIVTVNRTWLDTPGAVESSVGTNYLAVCHRAMNDRFAAAACNAIESVLRGERTRASVEYPCATPEEERWWILDVTRLGPEGGAVVVHTDITERVEAARTIQASELRYRLLFERNVAGVLRCTLDGTIIEANLALNDHLGVRRALEGDSLAVYCGAGVWDALRDQLAENGAIASTEAMIRRGDGRDAWLSISATRIDEEEEPVIQATCLDITETKLRETAYLQQAEIEATISAIYSDLLQSADGLDTAIQRALFRIAAISGAQRVYLLSSEDAAAGEDRAIAHAVAEVRSTGRMATLPPRKRGDGETILVPMNGAHEVVGAMVLESIHPQSFPDETLLVAHLCAEALARVLERKQTDERLRQANMQLEVRVQERTAELRALAAKLMKVQEAERKQMARDIHDELGQSLTELNLGIATLKSDHEDVELQQRLTELREITTRTIQSVQRFAAELRPPLLDRLGLIPALESRVEQFRKRSGVQASLRVTPPHLEVSDHSATQVYRIVQEALTNVARHAIATRVLVCVRATQSGVAVTVRDNGIGFETGRAASQSLGLLGMRERAAMIGGQIRVRSLPGRGTIVRLQLPRASGGGR